MFGVVDMSFPTEVVEVDYLYPSIGVVYHFLLTVVVVCDSPMIDEHRYIGTIGDKELYVIALWHEIICVGCL